MDFKLTLKNDSHDLALRDGANVLFDKIANLPLPADVYISTGYIRRGVTIYGNEIITLTADVYNSLKQKVGWVGDKWLHVLRIGGSVVDGYTAVIHLGVAQGILTEVMDLPPTEPPDNLPPPEVVQVNADVHITIRDNVITAINVDGKTWVELP